MNNTLLVEDKYGENKFNFEIPEHSNEIGEKIVQLLLGGEKQSKLFALTNRGRIFVWMDGKWDQGETPDFKKYPITEKNNAND